MMTFGNRHEPVSDLPKKADVAVVVVLPREAAGFRDVLTSMPGYCRCDECRIIESAEVPAYAEFGTHTLVATTSTDQGQAEIVPACQAMLDRFDPFVLVLLGIAGSIDPDIGLLDVVFANQVISYMKIKEKGGQPQKRGEGYPIPAMVVKYLNEVETERGGCPYSLVGSDGVEFRVHIQPVGTGTAVIGVCDSETVELLRHYNDKCAAVETEAHGVLQAFLQVPLNPEPRHVQGLMIVRGVSDHADEEKKDDSQFAAARNAAIALLELMRTIPPFEQHSLLR